jgi:hypothetical protein
MIQYQLMSNNTNMDSATYSSLERASRQQEYTQMVVVVGEHTCLSNRTSSAAFL